MKKTLIRQLVMLGLLLMTAPLLAQQEVKIGILSYRPQAVEQARWLPLESALNQALPAYHFVVTSYVWDELQAAVAARHVDFVLTNPGNYLLLKHRIDLSAPLVTLSNLEQGQPVNSFGGVIFARADRSDIRQLVDVRGKTVAATIMDSLGGYQVQAYELRSAGIHLPQDVKMVFTGPPMDSVVSAVLADKAEVGLVRSGELERLAREGKLDLSKIRIINPQIIKGFPVQVSTRLIPEWPLAALPQASAELRRKVAAFLLAINENKPLVKALQINGFEVPGDYSSVEAMLRELRVPPFEIDDNFTAADVWRHYHWEMVAAFCSLMVIMLLLMNSIKLNRRLEAKKDIVQRQSNLLAASELQLRTIIEAEPECVKLLSREGVVLQMNPAGLRMLEADTPEQIIGHKALGVVSPKYRLAFGKMVRDVFKGAERTLEFEVVGLKGGKRWLDMRAVPMRDAQGEITAVLGVTRDTTERRTALDKLRQTADELARAHAQVEEERVRLAERVLERTSQLMLANKAKDSFLATMSHEIRTPLGGLLGMMELLCLSPLNKEQSEMLNVAQSSGKSLLRIVDDILDWSKIEAGRLELSPRPASLAELLKGVADTYAHVASTKGLVLQQSIDDNLSMAYICDPLRIAQILNNFTSNAIKFSSRGSIELNVERIAQHDGKDEIRFSVTDNGIGIDAEQQSRLFQHYQQASSDTARMYGGTGLGLAICRKLSELMDGDIGVQSTPGIGSTFYFSITLPVASIVEQRNLEHAHEPVGNTFSPLATDGRQRSILLVDDHPVNRMLLKQQLEQLGLHVDTADAGIVALAQWWIGAHDLLITDCHMPGMDGYELTRSIRQIEQNDGKARIPIIAWTANALAEEEGRCRAAGMDDLLTKPTSIAELSAMLAKWLPSGTTLEPSTSRGEHMLKLSAEALVALDISVLNRLAPGYSAQTEMLQEFARYQHADIVELKVVLARDDALAIAQAAHRIKGSCRMVGAMEVENICARIEKAGRDGDLQGARDVANAELDMAVARLDDAVNRLIKEP